MNNCALRKFIFLFVFLSLSLATFSQQSEIATNQLTDYTEAVKLYNSKAYAAAQLHFNQIVKVTTNSSNLKANASYYEAMCAIKLNQTYADEKVLKFVEDYPNSIRKSDAFFNVGNYYFANKKAAYSLKWYDNVDPMLLSDENKKELKFKSAYALLSTNNLDAAKEKFVTLINDGKYGNDSRYYYGFIAYKQKDYSLAEQTLKEIVENKSYEEEVSYYLLDISFQSRRFESCISIGKKLLEKKSRKNKAEINKIIGESYFNLERYTEAIPYLKAYKNNRIKWNNTDYYQLGFAYFKQNDFKNAINNFNKIIDVKNEVAQNAYYNLGECYLQVDKKAEALNAFKSASEMDFSTRIKEDAALNYAKLSYEEGNPFYPVAEVLLDFLKQYPQSKSYGLINDLLVTSFIYQQNYQGALDFLAKKPTNDNIERTYEISLYRGIQLFNNNELENSMLYFIKAKKSVDKVISARAQYWEAEANYQLKKYDKALAKFLTFKEMNSVEIVDESKLINYNIGYCYFKLNKHTKAATYFSNFLTAEIVKSEEKNDALIRLADCEFATKEYQQAILSYQKVISNNNFGADYAQYQAAICFGFIGDNTSKISGLIKVVNSYSNSILQDDALFQIGTTYSILKENSKAHEAYERLLSNHKKSIFAPKTLMRQGLLFYNENKNEEALKAFKEVVSKYPNSQEALEAVASARNIYIDNGNIDEYVTWVKSLKFINIENSDIDNTQFAAAEKQYLEGKNNQQKISSLLRYVTNFPNGIHILKAHFYLGQTYFKLQNFDDATENYQKVINKGQTDYSEESLAKLSQIYLSKEDYQNAIPVLDRLEQEAFSAENVLFAQSNLMQCYYQTKAFDLAIDYARLILKKDKLDNLIANDAKIIIARSALEKKDFNTAQEFYTSIEKNAQGEIKAEALYYNAFFKNQNKDYEASNKVILTIISEYSSYKYWGVKSYLIMAKNYYGLNDVYQATYVLENIIENFSQFEDIITSAKAELNTIKTNEAKNNNSITPKN